MVKIEVNEVDSGEMRTRVKAEDFTGNDLIALLGGVIDIVEKTKKVWGTEYLLYTLKEAKQDFIDKSICDEEQTDEHEDDDEHELNMRIKDAIDKFLKEKMEA